MGRALIFLKDVKDISENDRVPNPEWYPVKFDLNDPYDKETGACVLVSFSVVDYDYEFHIKAEE